MTERSGEAAARRGDGRDRTTQVPAMEPLGVALLDHLETGEPVEIAVVRDDGVEYALDTRELFEVPGELAGLASRARSLARGRVLDVGAAAGRAALELQADGLEVWALDVCPQCVEVMRRRGVERAICGDVADLDLADFDSILVLMDTIGLAGSRRGLVSLLSGLGERLAPGGHIVLDASALEEGGTSSVQLQLRYRERLGAVAPWLYLDAASLEACAQAAGLRAEVVARTRAPDHFLARLSPL
ncbi:MAG: class I SAM-dependent methyltransferase [Myxococcota bacterium]